MSGMFWQKRFVHYKIGNIFINGGQVIFVGNFLITFVYDESICNMFRTLVVIYWLGVLLRVENFIGHFMADSEPSLIPVIKP